MGAACSETGHGGDTSDMSISVLLRRQYGLTSDQYGSKNAVYFFKSNEWSFQFDWFTDIWWRVLLSFILPHLFNKTTSDLHKWYIYLDYYRKIIAWYKSPSWTEKEQSFPSSGTVFYWLWCLQMFHKCFSSTSINLTLTITDTLFCKPVVSK